MKTLFITLIAFFPFTVLANQSYSLFETKAEPVDTTVTAAILGLPLQSYIGKPVDSLLNQLPNGFTNRVFMTAKSGYAKGIVQAYYTTLNNYCSIEIYIDTYNHLSFPDHNGPSNWNMNLAKQEIISFIRVVTSNNTCIYGCSNPNYFYISG